MGSDSMCAPCISALVMASMHGMHMLSLICMWDAYSTWICTVSWSYKRNHARCSWLSEYKKLADLGCFDHEIALASWHNKGQCASIAYATLDQHAGYCSHVDTCRILLSHTHQRTKDYCSH